MCIRNYNINACVIKLSLSISLDYLHVFIFPLFCITSYLYYMKKLQVSEYMFHPDLDDYEA